MTNIFNRQQWKLMQRGFSEDDARRIAYKQQKNSWNLIPWTFRLSDQWKEYSKKKPFERAVERKARHTWRPKEDLYYQEGKVRVKDVKKKRKAGFRKWKLDKWL